MKEIPMLRPFGEPSNMKIVVDDFGMGYITQLFDIGGELTLTPKFDEKGSLVGVLFSDNICVKEKQ
jgi:hypothetical protein